ncbi:hypothetical protein [Sphingobium sp. CR28]|uniref:hypothetical protein n=1 Tax=Sphingobium sp. CR28 TaxID=3400272 RepID=UPI003FEEFB62
MIDSTYKNDIYLSLYFKSESISSVKLIDDIVERLTNSGVKSHKKNMIDSLNPIIVGLLRAKASSTDNAATYRPMGAGDFTGEPIGYRPFKATIDGLESLGYLAVEKANKPAVPNPFDPAKASRFRATDKLIALAEAHGIIPSEWNAHFRAYRPSTIRNPIILRTSSQWVSTQFGAFKRPNSNMKIDPTDPYVLTEGERINAINRFMAEQDIQPAELMGCFQRIFSCGDDPSFRWNKGGRLYVQGGLYQQEPSEERKLMTIYGEPVVEIDIRASHLTILHALKGIPMKAGDPYDIPGIPRGIVKSWIAYTLGHTKHPENKWSPASKHSYVRKMCDLHQQEMARDKKPGLCAGLCKGRCLQKLYPMAKLGSKIAAHFPILDDWETSPWRWGDFQFLESEAIIEAVYELAMDHGIPALPVHDSLIVPNSKQTMAKNALEQAFERHVEVRPMMTVKGDC